MLKYCEQLGPAQGLSLKMLSFTVTMLLALPSGQRCQTLQALDIANMRLTGEECVFTITKLLKHTGQNKSQAPLVFKINQRRYASSKMCSVTCRRLSSSGETISNSSLVSKSRSYPSLLPPLHVGCEQSCAWQVWAGVEFTAHSTRAACTSATKRGGMSIDLILKCAGWSNSSTFGRFYDRHCADTVSMSSVLLP